MKSIKELFETAKAAMENKKDFVFVTVIASSGSTPRGAGSKMLVLPGRHLFWNHRRRQCGTHCRFRITKSFKSQKIRLPGLSSSGESGSGFRYDLRRRCFPLFQYLSWDNDAFYKLCCQLLKDWDKNENAWLILDITEEAVWQCGYYQEKSGLIGLSVSEPSSLLKQHAVQATISGRRYYSEPLIRKGMVYIFGGGHVAQELVPLLAHLDFSCTVFDDRKQFSNPKLFPDASRCIRGEVFAAF